MCQFVQLNQTQHAEGEVLVSHVKTVVLANTAQVVGRVEYVVTERVIPANQKRHPAAMQEEAIHGRGLHCRKQSRTLNRPPRTWPPVDQTNLKAWAIMDAWGRPDLMTRVLGSFVRLEEGKVHIVKEDGKRSSIFFATLPPSDRRFAENFELSAVYANKKYGDIDQNRRSWDYVSDESVITYFDERLWSLKPRKKGDMVFMVYVSHTTDYVELYNPKQQHHFRLFADHMEAIKDMRWSSEPNEANTAGLWLKIGEGNWKTPK